MKKVNFYSNICLMEELIHCKYCWGIRYECMLNMETFSKYRIFKYFDTQGNNQ